MPATAHQDSAEWRLMIAVFPCFAASSGANARVRRPGGHLLVLDTRGHFIGSPHYPLIKQSTHGRTGHITGHSHGLGDYLRAALPHGFLVRACRQTYLGEVIVEPDAEAAPLNPGPPNIWELHPWAPDAAHTAEAGQSAVAAWEFELRPEI